MNSPALCIGSDHSHDTCSLASTALRGASWQALFLQGALNCHRYALLCSGLSPALELSGGLRQSTQRANHMLNYNGLQQVHMSRWEEYSAEPGA